MSDPPNMPKQEALPPQELQSENYPRTWFPELPAIKPYPHTPAVERFDSPPLEVTPSPPVRSVAPSTLELPSQPDLTMANLLQRIEALEAKLK